MGLKVVSYRGTIIIMVFNSGIMYLLNGVGTLGQVISLTSCGDDHKFIVFWGLIGHMYNTTRRWNGGGVCP